VIAQSCKTIRIAHPCSMPSSRTQAHPGSTCGARSPRYAAAFVSADLAPPCKLRGIPKTAKIVKSVTSRQ
jgi:hypothetical protein